jgi:hypothetical protein
MPTPLPNIWQMQTSGDVESLTTALRHADPGVRQRAAAALRTLGAWHVVPALENALAIENDWKAHAAISAAIAYLGRDVHIEQMIKNKDVKGLSKMLVSPRLEDVITAAEALGNIGDRTATEALIIVFRNPFAPSKARLAAAEALLKLESAPAVVTLLRALRRDDWAVRRNAAAVLGQLQATWAVEPLIAALKDAVPIVRKTAEAALRRMDVAEAADALRRYEEESKAGGTKPLPELPPDRRDGNAPTRPIQTPPVQTPSGSFNILPPPTIQLDTIPLPTPTDLPVQTAVQTPAPETPAAPAIPPLPPVTTPTPVPPPTTTNSERKPGQTQPLPPEQQ